ncbi:MAG: hypothetical protein R3F11_12930 [Verrucomicrobiales bacterium]
MPRLRTRLAALLPIAVLASSCGEKPSESHNSTDHPAADPPRRIEGPPEGKIESAPLAERAALP